MDSSEAKFPQCAVEGSLENTPHPIARSYRIQANHQVCQADEIVSALYTVQIVVSNRPNLLAVTSLRV